MKMRAIVMSGHGGPEVLQYSSVDLPRISTAHDVLVRVKAAGVNPADCQARQRPFSSYVANQRATGLILGLDGAGVVEEVGRGVTRFRVGDPVYYVDGGFGSYQGSYAQFKVVNEYYLARKPDSLSFAEAAACPTALITSWEALYERAQLRPDQFVLIHGGAGGLGTFAIQLARIRGARVATTISTEEKAAVASRLGAELILRYRTEDVTNALRSWTGRDGADVVYDTVGHENFVSSFDLVAPHGTLVNAVVSSWPTVDTTMAMFKNIHVAFVNMGYPQVAGDHGLRLGQTLAFETAAGLFDSGELRVVLDRTYSLAQAAEAHRALESGEIVGRLALEID